MLFIKHWEYYRLIIECGQIIWYNENMKLLAQAAGVPIGDTFIGPQASPLKESTGLATLVSLMIRIGFVVSGVLILFFIIIAGFNVIAGAGSNNPESAKKGQQAATYAVVGFVIVFMAYWIVRLIEVATKVNIISPQ